MRKYSLLASACLSFAIAGSSAKAQVPLSAYVDANGFLDVQTLTCAQLAGTYQQDADALTTWYSGWYNGLAKKHFLDFKKGKETEHEVILYCEAHPGIRIIDAIAVIFKDERAKLGIEMK
jgi:HdeA/HdeB family